ncbi:ABC transporter permease [Streptomyces sp. SDr-06]|uniref:FtsX-like permease family protein n=1 Tax=Streptomyces sp. SDr-06 TaxID=2267702 RepID=UPI000DEAD665|nr:ABC transporter permease [Streptomyces sp. SDr-06]RCH68539.1 ABC transporter permease [Streptomyces sp. SDr-06]
MPGFVFLRVRAHRLLLAAALLAVLLTTSVLAALAAFSGSVSDAALRHLLATRSAAPAALVVKADVKPDHRQAAAAAVRAGAGAVFDGLPVTTRELTQSGPYALPRSLQPPDARGGDPDLTLFAAVDRSRVRLTAGGWPAAVSGPEIQVALPESAAGRLGLRPGATLALADRLDGPAVSVRITGVYRAVDVSDAYWRLDELGGRGVRKLDFTTYGPLLADPSVLAGGRVSPGQSAWLASADFSTVDVDRIGRLRSAATDGPKSLAKQPAFGGNATAVTSLPEILDRADRSLLVSRSTLLIVALQLVLLAGYALLLVARLLSSERSGETELLRARGGSRRQITWLAAAEALLLAAPAALVAPLLAGPLTRLIAGQGALARAGLHLDTSTTATVWLVAALVALGCALAVVAPALPAGSLRRGGRAGALPAPVRAGADIGLLVIAGVAYWQLDRQTSGSGAINADASGGLGIDPLLVTAPALALLAGTVLVLRLLPPAARLAERRAAGGRGLSTALAGWQFSRRPLRGAGPVLLLVLAVAMGLLTLGQSATWNRSQRDQADFRAGTDIRVLGSTVSPFGQAGSYDAVPGVRTVAPAARGSMALSAGRSGTLLALDTAHTDGFLLREDLAGRSGGKVLAPLTPKQDAPAGAVLPRGTERIRLDLRLSSDASPGGASPGGLTGEVAATLEDRFGMQFRLGLGRLPADGQRHPLAVDLAADAGAPTGRSAGPLLLTGLDLRFPTPTTTGEQQRLALEGLHAAGRDGKESAVAVPAADRWTASVRGGRSETGQSLTPATRDTALTVAYETGVAAPADWLDDAPTRTVRLTGAHAAPPMPAAIADDRFLASSGSKVGQVIEVPLAGQSVKVRIVERLKQLPTTGGSAVGPGGSAATANDMDGGALLLDLRAVNRVLQETPAGGLAATEWWLTTAPGRSADATAALKARPDTDPAQVVSRAEIARQLSDDPLGAGPQSALAAVSIVAAALAAVGFAVSAAGSLRERGQEFAVLRALGTPRRRLARLIAAEQGVLIGIALLAGLALGEVLTRAVVPLIVLTDQAAQPVPAVLVELPAGRVALLLAGVAAVPLLIVAAIALRRTDPAVTLRHQGGN